MIEPGFEARMLFIFFQPDQSQLAPVSTFGELEKNVHLISLGGYIPCPDTLVALVLANFGVFMVNFEKNVRFGGLTGILATFFGRYARKNAL